MADDISTTQENDKNDDNGYAASLLSTPLFTDFETIQCKPEPCSSIHNPIDEDQLVFDELSTYRTPVTAPMIRDPIVLLERCDKIWETLQLIKVVQTEKPVIDEENGEDKKEEIQYSDEAKQSVSHNMRHPALRSRNTVPLPFNFSVQKTKKLYPCTICGKHYQERRSLRKHSDRVHGIILPLLKGRRKSSSRLSNKKNFDKVNQVTLLNKESNNFENLNNGKNPRAKRKIVKTKAVALQPTMLNKFVKCTLCQQKVISLRKHLINYHKIGGSSNVVEQLESSLLIENGASSKDKKSTSSENVGSKKSSRFAKTNVQDGFRIMDNEVDACKPQIKRKRKFTLSYLLSSKKRRKYNNEHHVLTQHESAETRKKTSLNLTNQESYPCDICLGIYASPHSLLKHRRIHISRGETKENFHNVKCRYHNSPFNQKNKKLLSSIMSNHTTVGNTNNSTSDVQLRNSKHEIFNQNGEMNKNNNTTCLCGRSFRNPHTLFIHKQSCELYKEDGMSPHTSVSSDSGIGINITIKKNNNSYEIVGKDYNEDQLENSEIHFEENKLSISNTSNHIAKESVNLSARQKKSDKSELSNYSKDHSILKLHDAEEDVIIDIEDDGTQFDQNNTPKQIIAQQGDKKRYTSKEQNDVKNEQVSNKICTLRQMCQDVLDNSAYKSENAKENERQGNSLVENQDNDQIKDQEIHQDNKRKLRSSNRQRLNYEEKFDYFNDNREVCMKYNVLSICGYCHEKFGTDRSYYDHQCTVKEGRPFDEFSLELLCFYCKTILDNFTEYDMHMKVKHFDKAYHCYLCTERFASPKLRLQHINLEHNNMSCRFCNEKVNIQIKALHEGYHFGFGHPCHKCKKAYTNERNLSYHNYKSKAHPPKTDNRVTCSICLKLVKRRSIRTHMSTHKHNTCFFCGKVFSNKTGLEFHTMLHHGTQSKLKCNVCGTRFFTKKQLEKHAKVDGCNTIVQGVKNRNTASHD